MTLVYIVSSSRSGSTLLDLLLGNHEQIMSVGELRRLHEHYAGNKLCTCGASVPQCTFWAKVNAELAGSSLSLQNAQTSVLNRARGLSAGYFIFIILLCFAHLGLIEKVAQYSKLIQASLEAVINHWRIGETIARVANRSIVVDSSKWAEQAKLLFLTKPQQVKVIFLVRDGRAVTFSGMRRGVSLRRSALYWTINNLKNVAIHWNLPAQSRMVVKYEDLCMAPDKEMERICAFLDLPVDESAMVLKKDNRHNIGGSPHRFSLSETEIKLDEQWKHALTPGQLKQFNRIGGFLNQYFGYLSSGNLQQKFTE